MKSIKILLIILFASVFQVSDAQNDYETKLLAQFHKITSEEMMD